MTETKSGMQVENLMIGNYIKWTDESNDIVRVTGIYDRQVSDLWFVNFDGLGKQNGAALLDEFEPIPLCKELLIKLGFVWDDWESDTPEWLAYKVGNQNLFSTDISSEFSFINYYYMKKRFVQINFVHKLQNLYFALTGNHLTINP